MKFKGKKVEELNTIVIAIPRPEEDIVFIATAVLDETHFNTLVQEPQPPMRTMKGEKTATPFLDDPTYKSKLAEYQGLHFAWLVLTSLKATPDFEWETVDYNDPTTWQNYKQELRDAKITSIEEGRIVAGVFEANSLDETKIKMARDRFLSSVAPVAAGA